MNEELLFTCLHHLLKNGKGDKWKKKTKSLRIDVMNHINELRIKRKGETER